MLVFGDSIGMGEGLDLVRAEGLSEGWFVAGEQMVEG